MMRGTRRILAAVIRLPNHNLSASSINLLLRTSLSAFRNEIHDGGSPLLSHQCCKTQHRGVHFSHRNRSLDEFFETSENLGLREIKTAAPWSKDLLRLKSVEDLHKLWYVLLKERNMLSTMQYFYEEEDEPMPSPERLEKVAESMSNLRDVLEERESAKNMLLLGRPTKAHGEYRKSGLGHIYWYQYKEHLLPKHLAKNVYGDRPADTAHFGGVLSEWHIRFQERREKNLKRRWTMLKFKWRNIRHNNLNLPKAPPKWWLDRFKTKLRYGVHPELPVLFSPKKQLPTESARNRAYRYPKPKPR